MSRLRRPPRMAFLVSIDRRIHHNASHQYRRGGPRNGYGCVVVVNVLKAPRSKTFDLVRSCRSKNGSRPLRNSSWWKGRRSYSAIWFGVWQTFTDPMCESHNLGDRKIGCSLRLWRTAIFVWPIWGAEGIREIYRGLTKFFGFVLLLSCWIVEVQFYNGKFRFYTCQIRRAFAGSGPSPKVP